MLIKPLLKNLTITLIFCTVFFCNTLLAASSILIWPLNPVIESQDKANAIWLQNDGKKSVLLQIRVLKWQQAGGKEEYIEQKDVVASPPFADIQPGKKQFVRLVKNINVPNDTEYAYRILVDEIPRADEEPDEPQIGMGIKFQMRYSVPLFVQGKNIWTNQSLKTLRDINKATQPKLSYRIENIKGKQWLTISNQGQVHARLSQVTLLQAKQRISIYSGLLGYVLAGSTMQFQLPQPISGSDYLEALVNETPEPIIISKQ